MVFIWVIGVGFKLFKEVECWVWVLFVYKIGIFKGFLLGIGNF